jgi:hypothetical protein
MAKIHKCYARKKSPPRLKPQNLYAERSRGFGNPLPGLKRQRKQSLFGQKSAPQGLESLRENAVLEEGHGFSLAVNDTAIPGFSR